MTTTIAAPGIKGWAIRPPRLSRFVVLLLIGALALVAWLELGPVALGGKTSYVVTDGTSMLPKIKGDGIVLTRREADYHIGEVVAYHNAELHSVVLHRIIAKTGDRFVFKGDNNSFADDYQPRQSELVGKEWLYVPHAGQLLLNLRTPWLGALVLAFLGMWAMAPENSATPRRRRRHHARR